MPIYGLKCPLCGDEKEVICSYESAKQNMCPTCDVVMEIQPSKAGFHIEGYSFANGYSEEPDDHYDPRVGQKKW